jgi:hypothetical protein
VGILHQNDTGFFGWFYAQKCYNLTVTDETGKSVRGDPSWVDMTKPMRFEDGLPINNFAHFVIPEMMPPGRETTHAGSVLNPEIPFPQFEQIATPQQIDDMFRYVTQRDVLCYLDWNLAMWGIPIQIQRLKKELKDTTKHPFTFEGTREEHEHLLITWEFVMEHLDDPRLAWLKTVDEFRPPEKGNPEPVAIKATPAVVENTPASLPKSPEKTSEQEVIEGHKVPARLLMGLQRMSPESLIRYYEQHAQGSPEVQSLLKATRHVLANLDQYPKVAKIINDRNKGKAAGTR